MRPHAQAHTREKKPKTNNTLAPHSKNLGNLHSYGPSPLRDSVCFSIPFYCLPTRKKWNATHTRQKWNTYATPVGRNSSYQKTPVRVAYAGASRALRRSRTRAHTRAHTRATRAHARTHASARATPKTSFPQVFHRPTYPVDNYPQKLFLFFFRGCIQLDTGQNRPKIAKIGPKSAQNRPKNEFSTGYPHPNMCSLLG